MTSKINPLSQLQIYKLTLKNFFFRGLCEYITPDFSLSRIENQQISKAL